MTPESAVSCECCGEIFHFLDSTSIKKTPFGTLCVDCIFRCPACGETQVENEGDVCQACRNSTPEDWLTTEAYVKMCELRGEA